MARVPDATTLSNETSFAQDFMGTRERVDGFAGRLLRPHGRPRVNPTPLGVGSGSLFVSESLSADWYRLRPR